MRCPIIVQRAAVREHLCNYCATRISTVHHVDVRPSRALTMERLADFRPSDAPPLSGESSQYKGSRTAPIEEEMPYWLNLEPIPSMLPSWDERGCRILP